GDFVHLIRCPRSPVGVRSPDMDRACGPPTAVFAGAGVILRGPGTSDQVSQVSSCVRRLTKDLACRRQRLPSAWNRFSTSYRAAASASNAFAGLVHLVGTSTSDRVSEASSWCPQSREGPGLRPSAVLFAGLVHLVGTWDI